MEGAIEDLLRQRSKKSAGVRSAIISSVENLDNPGDKPHVVIFDNARLFDRFHNYYANQNMIVLLDRTEIGSFDDAVNIVNDIQLQWNAANLISYYPQIDQELKQLELPLGIEMAFGVTKKEKSDGYTWPG